jgi:hypothetical protein
MAASAASLSPSRHVPPVTYLPACLPQVTHLPACLLPVPQVRDMTLTRDHSQVPCSWESLTLTWLSAPGQ